MRVEKYFFIFGGVFSLVLFTALDDVNHKNMKYLFKKKGKQFLESKSLGCYL